MQSIYKTHQQIVVTPQMVQDLLPKYLSYIDEPYGDGSAIPTYYVCQLARHDVKVVLSGEGGDEVFAGYDTYSAYLAAKWFRRIPYWIRTELIAPLINRLPVSENKLSVEFKLKRFLGGQDLPPAHAHLWWRIVLTEPQKLALYSPEFIKDVDLDPSVRFFVDAYQRQTTSDPLARLMYIDSAVFLPDDLMIKNDRMSMAHSLEARVPMTDLDLTQFMAQVPTEIKMRHMSKKHVMRHAMKNLLPSTILNRKKIGFEMPYSRWFKYELKEILLTYLDPCRLRNDGIFQPHVITRFIDEHLSNRYDHGRILWGLLNYMMWLDLYIHES
ncbi:MAG: asparagine synthase C-terminal domain-containing protein [Caldilineaceae bacterium]